MFRKAICLIIIATFLMQTMGCYSSRAVSMGETEAIEKADKVKIATKDGRNYELSYVKIKPPTLKGYYEEPYPYNQKPRKLIELNIEDVQSGELKKTNYTVWAIGLGAMIWLIYESSKVRIDFSKMNLGPM